MADDRWMDIDRQIEINRYIGTQIEFINLMLHKTMTEKNESKHVKVFYLSSTRLRTLQIQFFI